MSTTSILLSSLAASYNFQANNYAQQHSIPTQQHCANEHNHNHCNDYDNCERGMDCEDTRNNYQQMASKIQQSNNNFVHDVATKVHPTSSTTLSDAITVLFAFVINYHLNTTQISGV